MTFWRMRKKKEIEAPSEMKWSWMLSGWFYLKKSNRREDRPNQTDHLRLQVAVKRGSLLSRETKDDEVHRGSDAHGVFKGMMLGLSVFLMSHMMSQYSKWVAKPRSRWAAKKNVWGCATRILRPFITGRRDWHCRLRKQKVGVELKRCCNMKRGPHGQRV